MPRRGNNLLKEDRKVERILCLWNILIRGRGVTREEIAAKLKVNETPSAATSQISAAALPLWKKATASIAGSFTAAKKASTR